MNTAYPPAPKATLLETIQAAINCHSAENGSDTPDFILAEYLIDCLTAFDKAAKAREVFYGRATVALPLDHPDAPQLTHPDATLHLQ